MGEVFKFNHYASAMEFWNGRVDSTEDYEAFRWHQWVQLLDLNEDLPKYGVMYQDGDRYEYVLRDKKDLQESIRETTGKKVEFFLE